MTIHASSIYFIFPPLVGMNEKMFFLLSMELLFIAILWKALSQSLHHQINYHLA